MPAPVPEPPYIGRFAPSPTGPLHFGSLIAAAASYLDARSRNGRWLVRMEDLDKPREMPGAAEHILQTLAAFGFEWDGPVLYQSQRQDAYEAAMTALQAQQAIYPCGCTRKEIADSVVNTATIGIDGPVYPGTCRGGLHGKPARAWRVQVNSRPVSFLDAIQGLIEQQLDREIGDFVIRRADGLFAYQLAVVVDDAEQQVSHVVRGADLLDSTPRQLHLQTLLGMPHPQYAHVPVATNQAGEKLSKQTLALPLERSSAGRSLWRALAFLDQNPPVALRTAPIADIWAWALAHWQRNMIAQQRALPAPPGMATE